jgi:hypothetical protein
MPFSSQDRVAIRNWLGFSELFHDLDPRLESQMSDIESRSPDAVTFVQARLADLDDIRVRLGLSLDNLDLIEAEDGVRFLGPVQLETLRDQGRMLVQQMAILFELQPKRDVFAISELGWGGAIDLG